MKIGYLHLAQSSQSQLSGVTRYGQYLAHAVQGDLGVAIVEHELYVSELTSQPLHIAHAFSAVDIVHIQYSAFIWHDILTQFLASLQVPVVVTLHDIHQHLYPAGNWFQHLWTENYKQRAFSNFKSVALRSTWRSVAQIQRDRQNLQALLNVASIAVTCHHQEKRRLTHVKGSVGIRVIPHFVEPRPHRLSKGDAKMKIGCAKKLVVTLQGYVYRTKGHELAIRALHLMSDNVHLIFAGGCASGNEGFLQELIVLAKTLNVFNRLRITGYLSEADLDLHLAATDLAICPFQTLSASGSLSSWIASETSILSYDLPQIQEYNQIVPDAITTFSPYTPEALANSIQTALAATDSKNLALLQLKSKLSLANIADQYSSLYYHLLNKNK